MYANLSLMGLYNYEPDLFRNLLLPSGVDRDTFINNLLMDCGELELLYPAAPYMMSAIGYWSQKQVNVWQKLYNTTILEYNPIHNYDRTEEWEDTDTRTPQLTTTRTPNLTVHGENSGEDVTTNSASAFNETGMTDREKTTVHPGSVTDVTNSGSETTKETGTDTHTITRKGTAYGNIGVTTTQQMLEAEREVVKFNIYDYIIQDFKQRFCLLVY